MASEPDRLPRTLSLTVLLPDASLFHALGVAPRDRFSDYEGTFRKVVESIQIMDETLTRAGNRRNDQ